MSRLSLALVACAVATTSAVHAADPVTGLRYVDRSILPYTPGFAGTVFQGTLLGGLSGIDFDAVTGSYIAISDDRSQNAPPRGNPAARFYGIDLSFDAAGFAPVDPIAIQSVTQLLRPDGSTFPLLGVDPESIRIRRVGDAVTLLWTSEGAASNSSNPPLQNPFLREMSLDGSYVREFAVPSEFFPDGVGGAQTNGIRNNLAFESLTLSADGTVAYVATESALFQDGPVATFAAGTLARIIAFSLADGQPIAQFAYPVDPIPVNPQGGFADNGLVELLATDDGSLLAVERAFIAGFGNHVRIYRLDTKGATDISSLPSLAGQSVVPVAKELLLALTPSVLSPVDNIEGITDGPALPGGARSFVLVSDNNFNATAQVTQFVLVAETRSADLDGDGVVGPADLTALLAGWGTDGATDLDIDGTTGAADLAFLLAAWDI